MYNVVEFSEEGGGGVSVIRREWLTPRKQRCMWPPQKFMKKFNKCIDGSIIADHNTWDIFSIKRVFYESDSLSKAREKAKQAEIDSEVNSDNNNNLSARKRKKPKKIYDCDDTDSENNIDAYTHHIVYPIKPATRWVSENLAVANKVRSTLTSSPDEEFASEKCQNQAVTNKVCSTPTTSTDEEWASDKHQNKAAANKVRSLPKTSTDEEWVSDNHQSQAAAKQVHSTPTTSTDEEWASNNHQNQVAANSALQQTSLQNLSSLDFTITPFLKETPNSEALDVIAKHLARIECDMRELQISQNEILQRLRSSSSTPLNCALPDEISLPCDDYEAMIKIETWINAAEENGNLLVSYLSLVGGTKKSIIIRRILEKVFTNKLAVLCNWTGKNKKIPLKDLKLIKIIRDAVRQNHIAEKATDAEIHEVISNWFRFTKDRDGGREARRVKQ